ncbi:glutamate-1-semialdehyde 2,1-aminomutase [Mycolicibacterium vaccae]|uniref:Glutamate-1-semialdehyde 2,1-aminomutase n=1 Tax=Mycolicibacterium vaccae ATCC 25954 TaxID=1194972 RepID=K0V1S4_MYCVA|nr:glutamate-1-semialdehyde 2,1-aminomutase [Mycolicibacterium vaccae]ANI37932.1 aminotransferase class III [Mycolicibacterium vaccae 95051]EJZ04924.1 glutamate-1-semialdehyde 2,1-aminomutase [Mycolicibacterium vaccae ATCC 25954]MCV7060344.1 glutamate-1-semialdehyde 2,1-aminomutase [Mycolicibacterium vaccae]
MKAGHCRGCGDPGLHRVLDLGLVPAADHFPPADLPVDRSEVCHPLAMDLCAACGLAQLAEDDTDTAEPRGVEPQALKDQAAEAVRRVADAGWLNRPGGTVREFGSPHGGSWLPLLGERRYRSTCGGTADVVLDCFGIMHDADQQAAFEERARATAPDGVLLLQFHSLAAIVAHGQWNSLRHGHFAYYSTPVVVAQLDRVGMRAAHAWTFDLYGGTVLVAAVHGTGEPGPTVAALLESEAALTDAATVGAVQDAADSQVVALRSWLEDERRAGRRVYAYGAASRAVALFARAGLDRTLVDAVADASPAKQGRRMPGTDVPIVSPQELVAADPDRVLLTLGDLLSEVSARWPQLAGRWVPDDRFVTPARTFARSRQLQERLHELVPGGAHTYARGADQYPEFMPPVLTRGSGCRVWDADGNDYIEYGIGLRAVTLGHGYPPVVDAAARAMADGVGFSRPTALEVAAAEDFLELVSGAEMVKFAKNGSDATTAAVRLARAVTGRVKVAVCDQPFFSTDDWFIGTTAMAAGIPAEHAAATVRFRYNDVASLAELLGAEDVACVVMEPASATAEPADGFLEEVRDLCDRTGTLLVFDEMITGFRWAAGGAQTLYGVTPDLSCWGKAMGNGFPLSALAGRRRYLELGGLRTDSERVFLLSTTHGPETASLAAFRAVVAAYRTEDPIARMEHAGRRLAAGVDAAVAEAGLGDHLRVIGRPSCLVFVTGDADGRPSQAYRTLFLQELLRRGVLGQSFVTSAAHTDEAVDATVQAVRDALPVYRYAIDAGSVRGLLQGRPVAPAIRRTAEPRRVVGRAG